MGCTQSAEAIYKPSQQVQVEPLSRDLSQTRIQQPTVPVGRSAKVFPEDVLIRQKRRVAAALLINTQHGLMAVYYHKLQHLRDRRRRARAVAAALLTRTQIRHAAFAFRALRLYGVGRRYETNSAKKERRLKHSVVVALAVRTDVGMFAVYFHKLAARRVRRIRGRQIAESMEKSHQLGVLREAYAALQQRRLRRQRARKVAAILFENHEREMLITAWRYWLTKCAWQKVEAVEATVTKTRRIQNEKLSVVLLNRTNVENVRECFVFLQKWARKRARNHELAAILEASTQRHALSHFYRRWDVWRRKMRRRQQTAAVLLAQTQRTLAATYWRKLSLSRVSKGRSPLPITQEQRMEVADRYVAECILSTTPHGLMRSFFHKWLRWRGTRTGGIAVRRVIQKRAVEILEAHTGRSVLADYYAKLVAFAQRRERARRTAEVLLASTQHTWMRNWYNKWRVVARRRNRARRVAEGLLQHGQRGMMVTCFRLLQAYSVRSKYAGNISRRRIAIADHLARGNSILLLASYYRRWEAFALWRARRSAEEASYIKQEEVQTMQSQLDTNYSQIETLKYTWENEKEHMQLALENKQQLLESVRETMNSVAAQNENYRAEVTRLKSEVDEEHQRWETADRAAGVSKVRADQMTADAATARLQTTERDTVVEKLRKNVEDAKRATQAAETAKAAAERLVRERQAEIISLEEQLIALENRLSHAERHASDMELANQILSAKPQVIETGIQTLPTQHLPEEEEKVTWILRTETGQERVVEDHSVLNSATDGGRVAISVRIPLSHPKPASVVFTVDHRPMAPLDCPPWNLMGAGGMFWMPEPGQHYLRMELRTQTKGGGIVYEVHHRVLTVINPQQRVSSVAQPESVLAPLHA